MMPVLARLNGLVSVAVPMTADYDIDPERLVDRRAKITYLCTPNNPTGAEPAVERVERLLERLEAPLLLDNAYGEFCRYDYRPLLARYPYLTDLTATSVAVTWATTSADTSPGVVTFGPGTNCAQTVCVAVRPLPG